MTDNSDENKPIYSSKIIDSFLKLLRARYQHVNIDEVLKFAGMEPYQVKDEGHFFSQKQVNLFYERLVQVTGNKNIAREAGRFASSPEGLGSMKGSIVGLLGPMRYYELLGKFVNKFSKASKYEAHRLGPNKVEIIVTPYPGVKEEPYQCLNRMGYWDAVSSVFHLKPPKIQHPECLFKGDSVCRYIVSWKQSPANIIRSIRNISAVVLVIACIALSFKYHPLHLAVSLPLSLLIILILHSLANFLEIRDLHSTVESLRNSSDELMDQIEINYENSLLINEIGQTLAKESDIKGLFSEVCNILQKRLDYDRGLVMLADSDKSKLVFQAGYGYTDEQLSILEEIAFNLDNPDSKGIFTVSFHEKKAHLINDIDEIKDDLSPRTYKFSKKMGVKSMISCPIVYEKESLGILAVDNIKSKRPLLQRDINLLMGIAPQIGSRIHNMRIDSHLRQSQKMEAVGLLAGGVAHDFNNILTTILGYSQILSMRLPPDDPLQSKVRQIHKAGTRASNLTRQLLAFSRKQVTELNLTNLNMIVDDMSKMLGRLIGEKIVMKTIFADKVGNIMADVGQVEQVLMNLVVNARDAMPSGGNLVIETGEVFLDEKYCQEHQGIKPGRYAMLAVTDSGVGMSSEIKERIFEPFFTTKPIGKGTGLGLSTVFGIIKKHNGHISVYSEQGKGSTIKVYFPITSDFARKHIMEETTTMTSGSETIIVVDDEESVRKLVSDTLKPLGYKIIEAESGEVALDNCGAMEGKIDLVLSDLVMPGMSGVELFKKIRDICPKVKAILMSGYAEESLIDRSRTDSNIRYINKPLLPISLAKSLREVLDKHE